MPSNKQYHRRYDKLNRPHINKMQRIRRRKAKLLKQVEDAKMQYEKSMLPVTVENWRIKNDTV